MFSKEEIKKIEKNRKEWEENILRNALEKGERKNHFESPSGIPLKSLYGPEDIQNMAYLEYLPILEVYIQTCIVGGYGQ